MECLKGLYLSSRDMVVPCGRCAFCAATRRSDWATRLHFEGMKYYGSKFVTLTYANNHLTWEHGHPQLVKSDLQKWFKRLRKAGHKFRYYAVGEYGSHTMRPHYHILVFGDVPEDALREAWSKRTRRRSDPFGHVHIGSVTPASVMYCLGYMVNGKSWRMRHKRVAPFCVMSRGRGKVKGLGSNYLSKAMIEWHKSDRKNYVLLNGEKRHLPRYYKTQIFSKIDQVRIRVRDEKLAFQRMVRWIRHPDRMRMRDPLAYYEEMRRAAAKRIKFKTKQNLII